MRRAPFALALLPMLAACGQSGDLYLPNPPPPKVAPAVTAPPIAEEPAVTQPSPDKPPQDQDTP